MGDAPGVAGRETPKPGGEGGPVGGETGRGKAPVLAPGERPGPLNTAGGKTKRAGGRFFNVGGEGGKPGGKTGSIKTPPELGRFKPKRGEGGWGGGNRSVPQSCGGVLETRGPFKKGPRVLRGRGPLGVGPPLCGPRKRVGEGREGGGPQKRRDFFGFFF